jgi:cation-transporting ATPase 13A3/4/5
MIVLYFTFSQMSDMQYLYVDLFIICPIFMTMALTEPYEQLSVQRPASSLFRAQCLISLFGQIFMQTASQVILIIILTK